MLLAFALFIAAGAVESAARRRRPHLVGTRQLLAIEVLLCVAGLAVVVAKIAGA